jgi:hypothetical protein
MNRRPVHIHVRELVLHGFDPRDRYAIAAAVRDELAAVLARNHAIAPSQRSIALERIDAGTVTVHPRQPRGIGTRIARVMKGALRK